MKGIFEAIESSIYFSMPTDNRKRAIFVATVLNHSLSVWFEHHHTIHVLTRATAHSHRGIVIFEHFAFICKLQAENSMIATAMIPHIRDFFHGAVDEKFSLVDFVWYQSDSQSTTDRVVLHINKSRVTIVFKAANNVTLPYGIDPILT